MNNIALTPAIDGLALSTPYDGSFVADLKDTVPYTARHWDKQQRRWIIAPEHGHAVADLIRDHFGVDIVVPNAPTSVQTPVARVLKLEYLARCKSRGNETSALGWVDGGWTVIFPEPVLRAWFSDETPKEPEQPKTLYAILGIKQSAPLDDLKRAYRQLARQWHPDVCREPDAREQFERIQHAYEVLRDETTRKKYDVGLHLELSTQHRRPKNLEYRRHDDIVYGYRAPMRCGYLLVEGAPKLGQFAVSKILKWDDIRDDRGRTMCSSWPADADHFVINWFDGGSYV